MGPSSEEWFQTNLQHEEPRSEQLLHTTSEAFLQVLDQNQHHADKPSIYNAPNKSKYHMDQH